MPGSFPVARWLAALLWLLVANLPGQQPTPQLVIGRLSPQIDGELGEWAAQQGRIRLDDAAQLIEGKEFWADFRDLSAEFLLAADTNHLYIAGLVRDDQIPRDQNQVGGEFFDRIEFYIGPGESDTFRADGVRFHLMPWSRLRPWTWVDNGAASGRQGGSQMTGVRVATKRLDEVSYQFEIALPFHHFPGLVPGAPRLGFNVALRDYDPADDHKAVAMSWGALDPLAPKGLGSLVLPRPGPLVSLRGGTPLLSSELIEDLPFFLVPLATVIALVLVLRGWTKVRQRAHWLRSVLLGCGCVLFALGLWLPNLLGDMRVAEQRKRLDGALATIQDALGKFEQGTLASYRGASRDRALMDLMAGKAIARQRYTTYRTLAELAPDQFGPGVRTFDDLPVRSYSLPLLPERPESFQFDPPLQGTRLFLVIGRPFVSSFEERNMPSPRLRLSLDYGLGEQQSRDVVLSGPFYDGTMLGNDVDQACLVPLALEGGLRSLSVVPERDTELRLVGISLEGARPGTIEPLLLGTPSLGGVLTDLRGAYPTDAGIELAPGATAKVSIPPAGEPFQKVWFFYRAIYPDMAAASPGTSVAELVLHFAGDVPARTIVLDHQVSMFYELAVHNTRDDPPEESPASIALTWVDKNQEKHINLVYPVLDLPAGAELTSIEFRNLATYRMRFRSVVFGNERVAAPQDPVDSPLVREGQERRLRKDVLDRLRDTALLIYRGGRLSDATLPADQRQDYLQLPRAAQDVAVTAKEDVLANGSRRVTLFAPLQGDGWDGAVLGVSGTDEAWDAKRQLDARIGLLLCLVGTPLLLVLLSELLAAAANLRFRLMTVMSLASLAPLGLLSLVLVQVLETGHAKDVQESMLATVRSSVQQLDGEKEKVRSSARQWLQGLAQLAVGRLERVQEAGFAKAVPSVRSELQKLLAGQLPPEWRGGFLRLEWQPSLGAQTAEPLVLVAGEPRMANIETPARLDPGLFFQWGSLLLGVRAEQSFRGGTMSLTAARPLDGDLLGSLAPGQSLLLTDTRGYPLAVSSGLPEAGWLLAHAMDPPVMSERERVLATALETRSPVVDRLPADAGNYVFGSEVLRDLQDTPRGLLVVAQPDQRASLDLAIGRIPVRAFFLLVAGSLVVLAAFLSFVVSSRISRPVERLEEGTLALSKGQLETRVTVEEGGQIGRLTRRFNQMAADLEGRVQDLQALNRAMHELSANDDEATIVSLLSRFCSGHTAADSVRIALLDQHAMGLFVHGGGEPVHLPLPNGSALLAPLAGVFSCSSARGALPPPWNSVLPRARSLLGLPITFAGRVRGVVLLGFERLEPLEVDLELLGTVVSQASIALERSQLHRLAVQDPVTGCFTPDYFRQRAVDEVSLAQQNGQPLAMVAIELGDGESRPRGLRRFAGIVQRELPASAVVCHAGAGRFEVLLPGANRAAGELAIEAVLRTWSDLVQRLPENEVEEQAPRGVVVQFPDEAPSTEFLFDATRARLEALRTPFASAMESDESLERAGVTAISPAMREVYGTLRRVAPTDLPILLEGETGVGKEVLTNLVHRWSRRAGGPLIKVHCAALSETLLASELFGHEKGAFTGADRRKIGRFEQADGGTLFLDEVGDIPLDVQVKLLRVLQEHEIDRVGGTDPVRVDVRVIAATNRDISRMVADGAFREDLYYRLQGMVVRVPPLRERKQELAGLIEHFRRELVDAGQSNVRALSPEAMDELYRREWPGNIRELRNTVLRAMVLARGDVVSRRDVLTALGGMAAAPAVEFGVADVGQRRPAGRRAIPADPVEEPAGPDDLDEESVQGVEPVVVLPALPPSGPPVPAGGEAQAERLRQALQFAHDRGSLTTQDHMELAKVSHRTALRDLQTLVGQGLLERVGSRRGAFYRPSAPEAAP
ncbi:MAG: sigma 54-interacting transcriptional regulator [Planctomycetes bacterium]|nr:sigma 54-interacting transcriptional regulator [Planctomycetota bacterium]